MEESWEEEASTDLQPSEVVEKDQDLSLLHNALNQLPVRKKEILLLSRFQNLKYREIAETMGISEEAVRKRVNRGVQVFRRLYDGGEK